MNLVLHLTTDQTTATAGLSIELPQLQTLPSIHGPWVPVVKHNELSSRGFPRLLQNKKIFCNYILELYCKKYLFLQNKNILSGQNKGN